MLGYFILLIVVHWFPALLRLLFSRGKMKWLAGSWPGGQDLNMKMYGTMEQVIH